MKLRRAAACAALGLIACGGCARPPRGDAPGLIRIFGSSGLGPGQFNYPRTAVLLPDETLCVIDKAGRAQILSLTGDFRAAWTMPQTSAGKPTGVGVDAAGRIYAADTHYARILIFRPDGSLERMVGAYGDGPGEFRLPTDVEISPAGTIYVSEYGGNDRVSIFDAGWNFQGSFGGADAGPGSMVRPQALRCDPDGSLWVADSCNHRVCHFTAAGEFLGAFGSIGAEPGQLRFPYGIDLLPDGTLIVCEYGNNRVQRFARDGRSLGVWGGAGRGPGALAYPWTVVAGPRGEMMIVDSGNNRIQVVAAASPATWR